MRSESSTIDLLLSFLTPTASHSSFHAHIRRTTPAPPRLSQIPPFAFAVYFLPSFSAYLFRALLHTSCMIYNNCNILGFSHSDSLTPLHKRRNGLYYIAIYDIRIHMLPHTFFATAAAVALIRSTDYQTQNTCRRLLTHIQHQTQMTLLDFSKVTNVYPETRYCYFFQDISAL